MTITLSMLYGATITALIMAAFLNHRYWKGHKKGEEEGFLRGYKEGFKAGEEIGYSEGRLKGYEDKVRIQNKFAVLKLKDGEPK